MDRELDLFSTGNSKEKDELVAKVMMLSLSSQPVEQEESLPLRKKPVSETGKRITSLCVRTAFDLRAKPQPKC